MKIHHIGYLVKNIDRAIESFAALGYVVTQETVIDEFRGVAIAFLENDGYRIELVSPLNADSDVADLRKRCNNAPYHICYEVANLDEAIEALQGQRFVVYKEPHEAVALDHRRVAFLMHGQIGLIELLEAGTDLLLDDSHELCYNKGT